jgi:uncharacterized repeat protein (TIGR02543 family)
MRYKESLYLRIKHAQKRIDGGWGTVETQDNVPYDYIHLQEIVPMKKLLKSLAFLAVAALAGSAFAQNASWVGGSYIIAGQSADSLTWYNANGTGQPAGDFNGHDFGTISTLALAGQVKTTQDDAANYPAQIGYKFDGDDETTTHVDLAWIGWNGNNNVFGYEPGDISGWAYPNPAYNATVAAAQILPIDLSGLAPGAHTISVWFRAPKNGGWEWDSNNSQNYTATFTVPETYTLVESADDLVVGADYLIVATVDGVSSALKNEANGTGLGVEAVTIDGTSISTSSDAIVWHLKGGTALGYRLWYNEAVGKFAAASNSESASARLVDDRRDDLAQWTIDLSALPAVEIFSVSCADRYLQRDGNSDNAFFAAYDSAQATPRLYRADSTEVQTVTFDPNGGTYMDEKLVMKYAKGREYWGIWKPTWEGHKFLGWYDEHGTNIWNDMIVTEDNTRAVQARWAEIQTVTFDANGGTLRGKASLVFYRDGVYEGFAKPTRDGYAFLGWFNEAGQRVKIGTDVTDDAELTLFAHWGQTVRFDGNGGTVRGKSALTCDIDGVYAGFAMPTRDGYAFLGWFNEAGQRVKIGDDVTDDAELTLFAHWGQTVRFDGNGGTVRGKSALTCDIDGVYAGFAMPTRDGYAFLGWFDEDGRRVKIGDDVTEDAERTLFAHWKESARSAPKGSSRRAASRKQVFTVDDCGFFPLGACVVEVTSEEPTVEELGDREEAEELDCPLAVTFQVPEGGVAWRFWSSERGILAEEAVSSSTISLQIPDLGLWHLLLFFDDSGATLSSTWLFPAVAE